MENYRKVTKDEFYNFINPKDIISSFDTEEYPFKQTYRYRNGKDVAKVQDYRELNNNCEPIGLVKSKYYLKNGN